MERLIIHGSIINDPLYNCSARSAQMAVNMSTFQPDLTYAIGYFSMGVINIVLFILCVKVMLEPAYFVFSAYKIMIVMSFCDMIGIAHNSLIYSCVYYYGISFCDAPNFIYIIGCMVASAWITSSSLSSVLVVNRLVEFHCTEKKLLSNIFNGKYTPLVMLVPITAGFYYLIREPSLILDPTTGLAPWDPQIFENASSAYFSPMIVFNNTVVVSFNSVCSIILCVNIFNRLHENFGSNIDRRRQITLFFQCLCLVTLCNVAALVYLINFIFSCPMFFQQMGGYLYLLCTSSPPYIYILLNRSIYHGILKFFFKYKPRKFFSITAKTTSTWSSRRMQTNPSTSWFTMIKPTQHFSPNAIVPQS